MWSVLFGLLIAIIIPVYTFYRLKRKCNIDDAGTVAAAYGSVSAVTFVTAVSFLESHTITFGGYMEVVMELMEDPAIIAGVMLIRWYTPDTATGPRMRSVIRLSITNGSVFLIIGSLLIGLLANDQQAQVIKPFTTDIFKGFLAIFLLDMGIASGKRLNDFFTPFLLRHTGSGNQSTLLDRMLTDYSL